MSCCGQKRAALARSATARTSIQPYSQVSSQALPAQTAPQPIEASTVPLRYLGATQLVLRGTHTGNSYYFEKAGIVIAIDASDVDALLNSQLFVREDG